MADKPDLATILAALGTSFRSSQSCETGLCTNSWTAAQRPTPVPAQQAQPQYQPPQQQYAPPSQHTGYGLPQPTSSGSLDLSSIKPVNSGTVSIAEAIAKAKAIAAEKGVSPYDRPPPQAYPDPRAMNNRGYPPTRSRSRSPVRRDNFRDNFNPYRDERRGDQQNNRGYRDRSPSPQRARSGFSPPGAGGYGTRSRSPPRGGDDDTESIQIESNLVGLIIGRAGENLRQVESRTGCRVQFITGPEETGPYRQCKITGSRANRVRAKAEINRIIEDSGMAANARAAAEKQIKDGKPVGHAPALRDGEDSMQIMVPDRTVGLIIGRGGETIRDLQERSGCHVNIVGESKSVNGLRPVNLIGSRQAAAHAKELILEIVESDSKGTAVPKNRDRDAGRDNGYGAGAGGGGGGDKITDAIFVPSEAVGMIIGKGGETIKDMQATTNCKINVTPSSGQGEKEREIGLVGSREAIAAAKRAIDEKVDAAMHKSGRGGGGGRGGNNTQQLDYGDRYAQPAQNYGQNQQIQQPQGQAPPASGAPDPYAAYVSTHSVNSLVDRANVFRVVMMLM